MTQDIWETRDLSQFCDFTSSLVCSLKSTCAPNAKHQIRVKDDATRVTDDHMTRRQYFAMFCNILQCCAMFGKVLQYFAMLYNVLQSCFPYFAKFCNVLQYLNVNRVGRCWFGCPLFRKMSLMNFIMGDMLHLYMSKSPKSFIFIFDH